MKKQVSVKYIAGWSWEEYEGVAMKLPRYASKPITTAFTKQYHNALYLLAGLNGVSRNLMDFLHETMSDNNTVYNNRTAREEFCTFISNITGGEVTYSDDTVRKAYQLLTQKGLLLPKRKGAFQVNPEYFFRQGEDKRIDEIRLILEFNANQQP